MGVVVGYGGAEDLVDDGGVDVEVAPVLAMQERRRERGEEGLAVGSHQPQRHVEVGGYALGGGRVLAEVLVAEGVGVGDGVGKVLAGVGGDDGTVRAAGQADGNGEARMRVSQVAHSLVEKLGDPVGDLGGGVVGSGAGGE